MAIATAIAAATPKKLTVAAAAELGAAVGSPVGVLPMEGSAEGETEGADLGADVGGATVGATVGAALGAGVGADLGAGFGGETVGAAPGAWASVVTASESNARTRIGEQAILMRERERIALRNFREREREILV